MNTIYGAYGANTHLNSMGHRCPEAQFIGVGEVYGWDLEFRGVADIVPNDDKILSVGLWRISKKCEQALDVFEGFPVLYIKKRIKTLFEGKQISVLFYVMNPESFRGQLIQPPPKNYYNTLYQGYSDCGLSHAQLYSADGRAYKNRTSKHKKLSKVWG